MARKPPEERGYIPVEDAAKGLRQLADDIEQANKGRLAKFTVNVWYAERPSSLEPLARRKDGEPLSSKPARANAGRVEAQAVEAMTPAIAKTRG